MRSGARGRTPWKSTRWRDPLKLLQCRSAHSGTSLRRGSRARETPGKGPGVSSRIGGSRRTRRPRASARLRRGEQRHLAAVLRHRFAGGSVFLKLASKTLGLLLGHRHYQRVGLGQRLVGLGIFDGDRAEALVGKERLLCRFLKVTGGQQLLGRHKERKRGVLLRRSDRGCRRRCLNRRGGGDGHAAFPVTSSTACSNAATMGAKMISASANGSGALDIIARTSRRLVAV